jgi:hypothetical protein
VIRSTLQCIMNAELSDDAWNQATLPVASGGLQIRRAVDVALPAYLSPVAGSHALTTQLLSQGLHAMSGTNDPSFTAAVADCQSQVACASVLQPFPTALKIWDGPLVNAQVAIAQSAASDPSGKARLIAAAAPFSSLGTRFVNASLRVAIAIRLGAPVCLPHVCVCGASVDSTGRHRLSCRKSAGGLSRHSAVNELITRALTFAEIPSRLEPTSLIQQNERRLDGMSLVPWQNGRCLAWDFTCPRH